VDDRVNAEMNKNRNVPIGRETAEARGDSYPDLVRHAFDLAVLRESLRSDSDFMAGRIKEQDQGRKLVAATLDELAKPVWWTHYENYLDRMGMLPNVPPQHENVPMSYPSWSTVVATLSDFVVDLGVASEECATRVRIAVMEQRRLRIEHF